ncbi:MAG TPA: ribosome-binding factor A, partial [Polyangiaceae bacterium]|nr:ribosome-binding factor A [Polyangiaceae bacterium]
MGHRATTDETAGHRHARLETLILDELRALLRDDVADPALATIQITTGILSVDYRHVRCHFVLGEGGASRADAERALVRATPFLRARLADAIDMKRTPELSF